MDYDYDDGFSVDLSGSPYPKPSFVSPIAVRYGQVNQKPSSVSPLDTRTTRHGQSITAAALAGIPGYCGSCGTGGLGAASLRYKMDTTSPIAVRSAPRSIKPDFISPLDQRTIRAMQTRTSAGLAGRRTLASMFSQFDPSLPITTTDAAARALNVARIQVGLDPMRRRGVPTRTAGGAVEPDDNAMEISPEPLPEVIPGGDVIVDRGFRVCEETMFRRADCTIKALPIVGGLVAGAVILGMLARG